MNEDRTSPKPVLRRAVRLFVALFSALVVLAAAGAVVTGSLASFPYVFLGAALLYIAGGLYMLKKVIEHPSS